MCRRQLAWWPSSCARYHISTKCGKRDCPISKKQKEVEKKISYRTPKCDACRGVWLPVQIWHWLGGWMSSILKMCGLGKLGKHIAWMFWMMFAGMKKITSFALGVPKTPRGKWWPKGVGKRMVIVIRGAIFLALLIWTLDKVFKTFETYVPWYSKLFWRVTAPVKIPLRWTWYQLTEPRRGMVEKVLYLTWDHTPAEVQALCHFLRGVLQYYVGWTWCEMRCRFFTENGWTRSVRIEGCRWECFNKL